MNAFDDVSCSYLRRKLFARPMIEMADWIARSSLSERASDEKIAEEMRRFAFGIRCKQFDTVGGSSILVLSYDERPYRLSSAKYAEMESMYGEQVMISQFLMYCWIGMVGWKDWFTFLNREPPLDWCEEPQECRTPPPALKPQNSDSSAPKPRRGRPPIRTQDRDARELVAEKVAHLMDYNGEFDVTEAEWQNQAALEKAVATYLSDIGVNVGESSLRKWTSVALNGWRSIKADNH